MGPKAREAIMHPQALGGGPQQPYGCGIVGPCKRRFSQVARRRHRADRCACSHYGRTDGGRHVAAARAGRLALIAQ